MEDPKFKKDLGIEDIKIDWEDLFSSEDFLESVKIFSTEKEKNKRSR